MTAGPVTVVVPTAGRADGLARMLGGLAGQHRDLLGEVIVVDNHPAPDAAVAAAVEAADLPARVVHEPRPGASHARNRGVAAASHELVAFLDDDVVPRAGWLASLTAALDGGGWDAAGGRVVLDPAVPLPTWMDAGLAGFVAALDLGPRPRVLEHGEYVLTANAIFPRTVLREHPLDPRLGPRPGAHLTNDDVDLVRRLRAAGLTVGWEPGAVVVHAAPSERLALSWVARRAYQQGRSDWRLDSGQHLRARLGGVRAAVRHFRARVASWWRHRTRWTTFAAHVLAEAARAAGFAREGLAAVARGRRAA